MGADFWECYTPYKENLREALMEVQETVFKSGACIRIFKNEVPVEIYFAGYSAD